MLNNLYRTSTRLLIHRHHTQHRLNVRITPSSTETLALAPLSQPRAERNRELPARLEFARAVAQEAAEQLSARVLRHHVDELNAAQVLVRDLVLRDVLLAASRRSSV